MRFLLDSFETRFNKVLAQQLNALYGNITAPNAIRNLTSIVQTGSLLTTYYDFEIDSIYTANARGQNESGPDNAYDRFILYLSYYSSSFLWNLPD